MRSQLIASFALVAFLGLGLAGGYGLYQYQLHLHEHVDSEYSARNQVVTREIEVVLDEIQGDLSVAANVPPIQGIVRARAGGGYDREGDASYDDWVKELQHIFGAMETAYQRYLQIRFLDENGNELVRVDWDGQRARPIPPAELQNKADRPYFQETMKLAPGQVYVSPLDLNQEWGRIVIPYQPTIRLATPIFDRQGERRGLVIVNVLGQDLLHRPGAPPREEGTFFFLADQRGYYVHHSAAPEKEWGGPEDLNTGHSLWADFPQAAGQILSGQVGEAYVGEWEIFYTPVQVDRQRGAFLVLGEAVPISVIQASVKRLIWIFGGVLALSLLLAVGTGYYLSRRIATPLEALRQGAKEIAGGRFDRRVQTRGSLEIADLANDFNQMASKLEELYSSLQAEYQHLFESASDSIFIHDLNGRFLAVNENAARRLGYSREELLRMSVQDVDTPEAAARFESNRRLLEEKGSLIFESAHRRKDSSVMPVEASVTLVEHRGQRVVLSFVRDISERKRAAEALRQEAQRAEGLRQIGEAINSSLDLDVLLQTVIDQARNLIGADYCEMHFGEGHAATIADLEPGRSEIENHFTKVFYCGFDPATCTVKIRPSLKGLNGEIFRTQKPLRLDDHTQHPRSVPLPEGHPEIGSFLGVPIIIGGRCVADILFTRVPGGRPFTEADERVAVTIANQAALAIQNAQLYEQVKTERVEEQAALLRLSQEFLGILEPQETMRRAVATAAEALHADCSDLMLLDEDEKTLTLGFSRGREHLIGRLQVPNTDDRFPGCIVRQKTPVIVEDVASDGRFQVPAAMQECNVVSALGVPVMVGEKAIGALIVDTQKERLFSPEEAHFLSLIANQMALAIEKARHFEAATRAARELV
ncbi:MAG: GAF domain-containing protein, partial [Chloroflexota bacterium]